MSKYAKILTIVLVVAVAVAAAAPAYADKGGKGKGKAQGIRHKETGAGPYGEVDPCEIRGDCGQGDHGQGDPEDRGQGSAHANCRAAQGEVDPWCNPGDQGSDQGSDREISTTQTDGSEGSDDDCDEDGDTIRICFYSQNNAVEVGELDDPEADPAAYEATVIAEGWDKVCWDATRGSVWFVLAWNPEDGHAGALYRVEVGHDATNAELHNPFLYLEDNGVRATRINYRPAENLPEFY